MEAIARSKSSDFPYFSDADVVIVLSPGHTYKLDSLTLCRSSRFFERALVPETAAPLSSKAKRDGIKTWWRVDLKLPSDGGFGGHDLGEADWGELFLRPLDERGRAESSNNNPDMDNGLMPIPIYKHYDNIFRAFYNVNMNVDTKNVERTMQDALALASIAENLECVDVMTSHVDAALGTFGQSLWRSIAAHPANWSNLALRLKSETLYREAVIHLVGQWPARESKDRGVCPTDFSEVRPETLELCERKDKELDFMKKSIETRIMGHYPAHMQKPNPDTANVGAGSVTKRGIGQTTRANVYQRDIFGWMAMCLFRHWLGQHVIHDGSRRALDGGWKFYEAIKLGGEAYIDHNSIEAFTKYFPFSAKARTAFEEELGKLKASVKPFVEGTMQSNLCLDISKWDRKYLVCAEIDKEDMPWFDRPGIRGKAILESLARNDSYAAKSYSGLGVHNREMARHYNRQVSGEMERRRSPEGTTRRSIKSLKSSGDPYRHYTSFSPSKTESSGQRNSKGSIYRSILEQEARSQASSRNIEQSADSQHPGKDRVTMRALNSNERSDFGVYTASDKQLELHEAAEADGLSNIDVDHNDFTSEHDANGDADGAEIQTDVSREQYESEGEQSMGDNVEVGEEEDERMVDEEN